jgi:transcriptional/translational regulatory protein YebC/TACO1
MADPGSVSYQFSRKGVIVVSDGISEDQILVAIIEHSVEDISQNGDGHVLTCDASSLTAVRESLQSASLDYESADVEFVSSLRIQADKDVAERVIRLVETLEDLDDVQNVYTNLDLTPEVLAQLS